MWDWRGSEPGAMAFDHGHWDTTTQNLSHLYPNMAVSSPRTFPAALTSMGWEGFSTGSSTSGFLGYGWERSEGVNSLSNKH